VSRRRRIVRGALAGAAATAVWSIAEVPVARALGHRFTDTRLLGRMAPAGPWQVAGIAIHLANGAAFGAAFAALGRRGLRDGVAAAGIEFAATWPGMALMDRIHPDRRDGTWPRPLLTDPRVFGQEALMHLLFGVVLGLGTAGSGAGDESPGRAQGEHPATA
jgi:hypothetical protein